MLQLFFGTDRQQVRDAATAFLEKNIPPATTPTIIDDNNYQPGQLADALGATSLFGGTECFLLDTPSSNPEFAAAVADNLSAMAESVNIFVVLEGKLLAPEKKRYQKHATAIEEFTAAATAKLDVFGIADALTSKDRRRLWVLLTELRQQGVSAEELIGILWWQLKTLRLAAATPSAAAAGMKDFPYNKAKRSLSQFAPGEVAALSYSLLALYHDGHAGVRDIDLALEQWVLGGK